MRRVELHKLRVVVLSVVLALPGILIAAPQASASCRQYIEGRCLENDICLAIGKLTGQQPDCIQ
jgi:hypothetical protein